jgi:two-component system, response regulator PdtaR
MARAPRWRVVIVDDHERSRAALRAAVWAAGGEIVGEAVRGGDALGIIMRTGPDVAVFAIGLPDGDGIELAAEASAAAECPVVLVSSHTDDAIVSRASAAGVMAFLVKPLRPSELRPALDIAIARFREVRELRRAVEDRERALEERKVIERAKGLLMTQLGLAEDEAFRRLRRAAMDQRRPMIEIARALLVSASVAQLVPPE